MGEAKGRVCMVRLPNACSITVAGCRVSPLMVRDQFLNFLVFFWRLVSIIRDRSTQVEATVHEKIVFVGVG